MLGCIFSSRLIHIWKGSYGSWTLRLCVSCTFLWDVSIKSNYFIPGNTHLKGRRPPADVNMDLSAFIKRLRFITCSGLSGKHKGERWETQNVNWTVKGRSDQTRWTRIERQLYIENQCKWRDDAWFRQRQHDISNFSGGIARRVQANDVTSLTYGCL